MIRCALCPRHKGNSEFLDGEYIHPMVPADGPEKCEYLFIGESPGKDETNRLKPFVGRTGQEVNEHYLPLAGLRRSNVRMCNAISCQPSTPDGKLHPENRADQELLQSCVECNLDGEIERVDPRVIITMGSFAATALDPTIDLDLHHGIPREIIRNGSKRTLIAFFHPALGMYTPKSMLMLRTDWDRLRRLIRGTLYTPIDEYVGNEDYREISTAEELNDTLYGEWDRPMGADTETTYRRDPYCWSYSTRPGTGYVVRADNEECKQAFQENLDKWTGPILFHNYLFDDNVNVAIGLRYPSHLIVDTMERVYQLGNLPQGLKALAYRELGMQMQDFMDLVRPYSTPIALEYLREALSEDWPKPPEEMYKDFKSGEWKIKKPQGMGTKIKRFLTAAGKEPDKADSFKAWDNWEDSQASIETVCGPWPGLSIEHVPWYKAVHYAARDSDTLVRLWPIIKRMASNVRKKPQEKWRDIW